MFKNLHELIAQMPDEKTCREYYEQERWNGKPVCPYCGCERSYKLKSGKHYKCASGKCYKVYTVTVGTIFEASNIPLNKWFMALYLCSAHKKGISSVQLAKDIGVTQKTSWFMLHRLRVGMRERGAKVLIGTVELDETYLSRKFRTPYKGLSVEMQEKIEKEDKRSTTRHYGTVIGVKERGGKIIVVAAPNGSAKEVKAVVEKHVSPFVKLMTDEAPKYKNSLAAYHRQSVNHSAGEWVRGDVHTNGVENFWSVMKRGVYGIYHQISYKHLQAYCNEFSYRYNSRKMNDADRFSVTLRNMDGRLKYKSLINKISS